MLNKHCKMFLSFLIRNEPDYENGVYTYQWIEENYCEPLEDVYRMVRFLDPEGFVKIATMNGTPFGIVLEEKGKYYKQFYWEEIKESFFKSIFLPVLVALLTYIFTQFASNIWSTRNNFQNNHDPNVDIVTEINTAAMSQAIISPIAAMAVFMLSI